MARLIAMLVAAALAALPAAGGATPVAAPMTTLAPGWYAEFLRHRNEALGAWLPANEDIFEPWRLHRAAVGALGWSDLFTIPPDATFFWHGEAGPPKVHLVYDPVRRVALFSQGCCSWQETILATVAKPPPGAVKTADLAAMRTRRGIGLGASPDAVRRAYGKAVLYPSTAKRGLRVLAYYRMQYPKGSACGWFENFVFRGARLIEIQAGHGC